MSAVYINNICTEGILCIYGRLSPSGVDEGGMSTDSLSQTGLMKKVGAEVCVETFETEWNKHGGEEYLKSVSDRVTSPYLMSLLHKHNPLVSEYSVYL